MLGISSVATAGARSDGMDTMFIIGQVAGGGVDGGVLLTVIGMIKSTMKNYRCTKIKLTLLIM